MKPVRESRSKDPNCVVHQFCILDFGLIQESNSRTGSADARWTVNHDRRTTDVSGPLVSQLLQHVRLPLAHFTQKIQHTHRLLRDSVVRPWRVQEVRHVSCFVSLKQAPSRCVREFSNQWGHHLEHNFPWWWSDSVLGDIFRKYRNNKVTLWEPLP